MRVLGIDPGSIFLGLGCVESSGNTLTCLGYKVAKVKEANADLAMRFRSIAEAVREALDLWQPQAVAVEEVFFAKNAQSALMLGQARGVALAVPALKGLPLHEYPATLVKQTVTGSGRADKDQVQRMVMALLGGRAKFPNGFERADASDALAVAICHLQHRQRDALWKQAVPPEKRFGPAPGTR